MMEISIFDTNDPFVKANEFYGYLQSVFSIIEHLNLNTRIWTKTPDTNALKKHMNEWDRLLDKYNQKPDWELNDILNTKNENTYTERVYQIVEGILQHRKNTPKKPPPIPVPIINNVINEKEEKKTCPKCREENLKERTYCWKCYAPL